MNKETIWSYSRLTMFEDCPYQYYLRYIAKVPKVRHFFTDYGSFIHLIIQKYLDGELGLSQLATYYLIHFNENVSRDAPSEKVFSNYFQQGYDYFLTMKPAKGKTLGVEKKIFFNIGDKKFIGYIDRLAEDDGLQVIDNKSKDLKARSTRAKPTKTDLELDRYLRQLYLYSIAVKDEYGSFPKSVIFNCFRTQKEIVEPFKIEDFEKAQQWATKTIKYIENQKTWPPNMDFFKCRYLCAMNSECEYYEMSGGKI